MSGKPLCIAGVVGVIVLFWSAWSWDEPKALAAPPTGLVGADAGDPFAEPARATPRKATAVEAGDPFASGPSGSLKGEKKTAVTISGVAKKAAKKGEAAPAEKGRKAKSALTGPSHRRAAEAKIQDALDSLTEVEFVDTPLSDVVAYLQDLHKINIAFDRKALDDAGIGTDKQITRTLKGVTLQSALRLILRDLKMTYVIGDEVLLLTTADEAQERLITKPYAVADLVSVVDENNKPWDDYNTLIGIVTHEIKPATWDSVGGCGTINGATFGDAKLLVISHTEEVHEEVARLLQNLLGQVTQKRNWQPPVRPRPHEAQGACGGARMPAAARSTAAKRRLENFDGQWPQRGRRS